MRINFNAKKLKEASKYVNLLDPSVVKEIKKSEEVSLVKKILKFLFK